MRKLRLTRTVPFFALVLALCTLVIGGCGSSNGLVQIERSSGSIDRPMLNHWMRAMAGGDFNQDVGHKGPAGFVSEPANYPECERAAKTVVPRDSSGRLKLNDAEIARKCHELYRSIKAQALSYLISVQWSIAQGDEVGFHVSDALLKKEFANFRKGLYPTEADLQHFLSVRQWALSDILYQLKRNLLVRAILPRFEQRVSKAGGGERVYAKLALQRLQGLVARTSCEPGYVVPNCKQYHGPPQVSPAPGVIFNAFAKGEAG